ncbi:hypothetical protein ACI2L1_02075 [Streptomyces sp. NPDC019531]|uniref:hypothetical protein n=1 Tax=Streptomyces sp. NPDC019531 TaxID=3365062 RepID=UPI00384E3F21
MTGENTAPTGPPQVPHQQPRWAWWVVGIVVPLVGVLITILLSQSGSSDDESDKNVQPAPTRSTASTHSDQEVSPSPTATAAKVRYGPVTFDVDLTEGGMRYVDLDSTAPVVTDSEPQSNDLTVSTTSGAPTLYTPDSANTLASLAEGITPTEAQCFDAVEKSGTYTSTATRGARFCLTTPEGRTAYLSVVSAANGRGTAKFKVTVWETPDV